MLQPSKVAIILKFYSQKTDGINNAEILPLNGANERPHKGTLKDLSNLQSLAVILNFYSQKTSLNRHGRNSIHKQSKCIFNHIEDTNQEEKALTFAIKNVGALASELQQSSSFSCYKW